MGRPRAAVGEEHEVGRVVAGLDRHLADEVGHPGVDDRLDPLGSLLDAHAERVGHVRLDRRAGLVAIERSRPPRKLSAFV